MELHRTLIGLLLLVVLLVGVGLAIYTVLLPKLMREEGQGLLGQNPVSYDTSGTVNVF